MLQQRSTQPYYRSSVVQTIFRPGAVLLPRLPYRRFGLVQTVCRWRVVLLPRLPQCSSDLVHSVFRWGVVLPPYQRSGLVQSVCRWGVVGCHPPAVASDHCKPPVGGWQFKYTIKYRLKQLHPTYRQYPPGSLDGWFTIFPEVNSKILQKEVFDEDVTLGLRKCFKIESVFKHDHC